MTKLTDFDAKKLAGYVHEHGHLSTGGHGSQLGGHGISGHGDDGRQMHHMYVPMAQKGYMLEGGKKVPVHNLHVKTRSQFLSDLVDSDFRTGGLGTAYKAYFWAVICFGLTVLTYGISVYLAAVFAYLTGMYWSQRLVAPPWNITWFKGKALYHTK